jgi:pimeloyl-ACP methyl ester carboxylesterase
MADFEPIAGSYFSVLLNGERHRIYLEEAGRGIPLFCLHTAGADSRQFRHVLNDSDVTDRFHVFAFDLPFHGRSNPPDGWWLKRYRLTTESYVGIVRGIWRALGLVRPILMGCSMGGAVVLKMAAEFQDELTGVIGLESSAYSPGRYSEYLHHPAIDGSELCASYTYGLNSPYSPEASRRENWWIYSQAGPGVYQGDVHFYSNDWDGRADLDRIDTKRCKVALLTGEYDYSCTPEMTKAVASAIPGSHFTIMKSIGHFPMIENYPAFRPYLLDALRHVTQDVELCQKKRR